MVNFPASLDSLANPTDTTKRNASGFEHHLQHSNANDILEAVETKLGTGASTPTTAGDVLYVASAGATAYGPKAPRVLYDTELGAPDANVDITSIVQTFRSLRMQIIARGSNASTSVSCLLRFNNDSGNNYDYQNLQGNNTAAAAFSAVAGSSIVVGGAPAASATANVFGQIDVQIGDYINATRNKVLNARSALKIGTTTADVVTAAVSGFWRSNAAITRITLIPSAGNWDTGTRVIVWGDPVG